MSTVETSQGQHWGIAMFFAIVTALALIVGGILYYQREEQQIVKQQYDIIHSVATLKVGQIVAWLEERRRDAKLNAFGPLLWQTVRDLLLQPADEALRGKIQNYLQIIQSDEAYQDVIITSTDGRFLLSASGQKPGETDDQFTGLAHKAISADGPVVGELTPCPDCPQIVLDVAMALVNEDHTPLAVLILRTDVHQYLYPLLLSRPIPSASAETILVRRNGENALVLSPQRNPADHLLGHSFPLTQNGLPHVQAVQGKRGIFYGRDCCDLDVVGDLQAVPGTSWVMVAKIDRDEANADVYEHGWFIFGLTGLSVLMTTILAAFLYSYRQRHLFHSLYRAEQDKRLDDAALLESAKRLAKLNRIYILLNAANKAIVRERKPQALFAEACRIAVEVGGYRMAWVGVLDEQTKCVHPVAQAGVTADYLEQLGITLDDTPRGHGPTASVFRNGQAVVANDIESNPSMEPWREKALQLGYRSSAAFPLVMGGGLANLNLYSSEPESFDQDEIQLLDEMVQGINFALEFMEQEKRRQVAESELRKFFRAIEQSPASIIITDTQGVIEYVNPKFLSVTGYTPEEVLGKNPRILKSGETLPTEYCNLWLTITAGGEWHGEFHNRKKDGTLFWERAAISAIRDAEGQVTNFLAVKEDITSQKILEEQLMESRKMETIGRLAGGVAHDFNNMLGVILGSVELALDQVQIDAPLRIELEEIRKAAERSADLTRQLLAFARKQIISPQTLSLNTRIESMLVMLQRLLGEDISLVWRPSAGLWPIKIDPSQVDQIIANLTVNARDAIERQGSVTIETANVVLDESFCQSKHGCRPGDYVMLAVRDTGAGMDQSTLAHIFEPFFTTKGLGKGTGLGLATIYGIVKQNNGCIFADSELGVGTAFRIYLPRVEESTPSKLDAVPGDQELSSPVSETVLLVEDEGAILELAERILCRSGYTVLTACHPDQGLELAASHPGPLHLLITDIVMPAMNGKEFAEQVTALRPDIKTLFMSGYTADMIARHGLLETDISFMQKPFSKKELLAKVRLVLDS